MIPFYILYTLYRIHPHRNNFYVILCTAGEELLRAVLRCLAVQGRHREWARVSARRHHRDPQQGRVRKHGWWVGKLGSSVGLVPIKFVTPMYKEIWWSLFFIVGQELVMVSVSLGRKSYFKLNFSKCFCLSIKNI